MSETCGKNKPPENNKDTIHYYVSYKKWQNHSQNVNAYEGLVPDLRRNHWRNATN